MAQGVLKFCLQVARARPACRWDQAFPAHRGVPNHLIHEYNWENDEFGNITFCINITLPLCPLSPVGPIKP